MALKSCLVNGLVSINCCCGRQFNFIVMGQIQIHMAKDRQAMRNITFTLFVLQRAISSCSLISLFSKDWTKFSWFCCCLDC